MKYRVRTALLLCVLGAAGLTRAQAPDPWVEVSSAAEHFRVSMPHKPKEESFTVLKTNFSDLEIKGKSYQASANGANYRLWVLTLGDNDGVDALDMDNLLDASAEVIWEGLMKSERDKLPDDHKDTAAMTYVKELAAKPLAGREYTLTIGAGAGTTQFYVAKSRVYVLLAMNAIGATWQPERFFQAFALAPDVPGQLPVAIPESGVAVKSPNDITDNEQIFRSAGVTSRARVLEKPEPSYTESARKFSITGTVILRCVFSSKGEVTNLRILRKLPHGLTQRSLNAARLIRFTPALKDGKPVSMWMQLEYNFNLY